MIGCRNPLNLALHLDRFPNNLLPHPVEIGELHHDSALIGVALLAPERQGPRIAGMAVYARQIFREEAGLSPAALALHDHDQFVDRCLADGVDVDGHVSEDREHDVNRQCA